MINHWPAPAGATSYNLWENPPSVIESVTDQYFGGTPVAEPPVNDYLDDLIVVDDSDSDFFTTDGGCWTYHSDTEGVNGGYYQAEVELVEDINNPPLPPNCYTEWTFDPEIEAPSGDYDVYIHVPDYASTLHAYYTVRHNGQTDEAVVVQAAYPNDAHDAWAYLGRYDFGLNGSPLDSWYAEYIQVSSQTISETASIGTIVVADAIRLLPADSPPDLEIPISQSSDDAGGPNQYGGGIGDCGSEHFDWNEIYLGHCINGSSTISGFRFQDVAIPDGAVVTAARLEFTVDTSPDNVIDVQFRGELAEDAVTFSVGNLPSDRISSLTSAVVPWHIANDGGWQVSEAQVSPDLSTVVQEVIAQPDWNSGNAIVIIMQPSSPGTVARRVFGWDRYFGNPLQSAKLQIWYTKPPRPPAPTNLTAVYRTDGLISAMAQPNRIIGTPEPAPLAPYVVLSWQPNPPPFGTTFNVYRSRSYPLPSDFYLIASRLRTASFKDYNGRQGDWYRVTAVDANGESLPSNIAQSCSGC